MSQPRISTLLPPCRSLVTTLCLSCGFSVRRRGFRPDAGGPDLVGKPQDKGKGGHEGLAAVSPSPGRAALSRRDSGRPPAFL